MSVWRMRQLAFRAMEAPCSDSAVFPVAGTIRNTKRTGCHLSQRVYFLKPRWATSQATVTEHCDIVFYLEHSRLTLDRHLSSECLRSLWLGFAATKFVRK